MRDAGVFGSDPSLWESVGKPLSLPVGEVHVWQADLDRPGLPLPTLAALLSPEECTRAARFLRDSHRDRFVAARGILRLLLGRYTASPPESLRFVLGPNGKPELASDCNPDALHFNRTDSSALALYAFSRERRIGIDVEQLPQAFDYESLARSFFHPHETAALLLLPVPQRLAAFFACWTRKEAYLKARGEGLSFGLSRFAVSLLPNVPPLLLETSFDPSETLRWSLHAVEVPPGYAACLAVETQSDSPLTIKQLDIEII